MSPNGESGRMLAWPKMRSRLTARRAAAVDHAGDEALDAVESASLAAIELTRKAIARLAIGG